MRKTSGLVLLVILTVGALFLAGCGTEESGGQAGEDTEIKIGQAPYDYEVPMVEVTKQIAEEQGYEVEVVEGDVAFMFMSLAEGDIDIWPGVWLPAIHGSYHEDYEDQYELGSAIFEEAPTGWAVPEYMDIDSIEDLQGNEDIVDGQLTGFEPGSGMMLVSEEVVEGYDLDMEIVSGSLASMMSEVDYAIENEENIVFLGWRPHTMFMNYDVKILEDPEGYWELDDYLWGINFDFEEKAPDMYQYVTNFKMSIDDTEEFLYAYQEEDEDVEELAAQWIEEYREDIDAWLEQ